MRILLILTFLLTYFIGNAQIIVKVQDGTFIKLFSGSQIIVSNPSVNPIRKSGNSGGILTPSESEKIIINVSNLTGQINIPFVSSVGNTIPFDYTITTGGSSGGKISFSTYETGNNNLPYPSGVTNVGFNGVDNSDLVIDRFWLIDVTGYTTKPQGIYTFTYDDNDLIGNNIYEPDLFMQRWNDVSNVWGDWLYSPLANTTTNQIILNIANPQDQFKVWTAVDQGQPLPIELISFKSNCSLNKVEWITVSETNNEWFVVQGTNDGINFTNLDTISGAGFSNSPIYYSIPILDWGFSYFRLQQKDFDGRTENSFIIGGCPQNGSFEPILYPNPNNGQFIIKHNSEWKFEVFDLTGRLVWTEFSSRVNFDLTMLAPGQYTIKLLGQWDKIKNFKFIKIN